MSAFERAARLFEHVRALPARERAAALAREPDGEVRALAREMLAGEASPVPGLEAGLPGLGTLIGAALAERDGPEPLSEPAPPFELVKGPYRVQGVLARGGMGVVLRGRDEAIGRDVAIKVLRDEALRGPEDGAAARLRFLEEAQVAGQLEHPGVVPVHHLGTDDAGRPFFAMKLVEGETLAARLAARADPAADRPRLLALFLKVCETVAYAHARQVIHRDLKPANVMVGAFGEVQVLDWGLAKVLGTADRPAPRGAPETVRTRTESGSASVSGTVMGTPRYMPPEQARGDVERLDRRADVFSLGAILCEILTGEPPFPGEREAALEAARAGRVGLVLEPLARCGADPALVALARRALAADPAERPADAGELAAGVEHSLAAVEERARDAELAAETARARAASERRARRLTLVLATSAAAFAVVLVALFQWRAHERERDAVQLSGEAAAALDVAAERFAVAREAPLEDGAPWGAAALALEAAERLLAGGTTTAAVRARAARLRADFEPARDAAAAAAAALARDRALAARLEEIRTPTGDGIDPYDWPRMQAEYYAAFADYGIDITDAAAARARLSESTIGETLGQALDQWAIAHRILAEADERERAERFERLLSLAAAADPDTVRDRVRAALGTVRADPEAATKALRELAADVAALEPESVLLLAGGLRMLGDDALAADALRRAVRGHRGDFWLSLHAALALSAVRGDAGSEEAIAYFHGALGARPASRSARHYLGKELQALGRLEQARAVFAELVELDPADGHARAHLGQCVALTEGFAAALPVLAEAARRAADDAYAQVWHARALEETGRPWAAVEPRRRASELDPSPAGRVRYAGALDRAGLWVEADAAWQSALALHPDDHLVLYNAGTMARGLGDLARAEDLLRRCTEVAPELAQAWCNLGAVLSDRGRYAEAAEAYRRGDELGRAQPGWSYPSAAWIEEAERRAALAADLDGALRAFDPAAANALELATVALARDACAAASDAFARLAEHAGELAVQDLDLAARAAARAAAADDATDLERAVHAERALARLAEIRTRLMRDFRADPPTELGAVRGWLGAWRVDPALAALRAPAADRLPADLRDRAASFWAALDADLDEIAVWIAEGG